MTARIDRRAARTRRALHGAMIALILRKGYDAISVQDIIDEADVGRSTFYAHYTDKADLLRGGFAELRADLTAARARADGGSAAAGPLSFSLAVFEHCCGYKQVFQALIGGQGGVVATGEIRRILTDMVREDLSLCWNDNAVARNLAVPFVVSTFVTVLSWLLDHQPKVGPAEADRMFRRLVLGGIGGSIGRQGKAA